MEVWSRSQSVLHPESLKETSRIVLLKNDYICEYCGAEANDDRSYVIPIKKIGTEDQTEETWKQVGKRCNAMQERLETEMVQGSWPVNRLSSLKTMDE